MAMENKVRFNNLIKADGTFKEYAEIETVTVPEGGLTRGSTLELNEGKYTFSGTAPTAILADDLSDAVAGDVKALVFKSGSFIYIGGSNSDGGVIFADGQTIANTKTGLQAVSIEITQGVM